MQTTYADALYRGVFPHEGGYTNHPADPGGPTNWGITIADARAYWRANATAEDVRNMPRQVAVDIYRQHYAAPLWYNDLPAGVDYSVLDYGINSGIGRAGKVLRRLVELPDDTSRMTKEVLDAVLKRDPVDLINAINDERLAFLRRLKTWPTFGAGWERRINEVRALSLSFAKHPGTVILSNKVATGKGAIPEPKAAKNATATAAGGAGTGLVAWAYSHPQLTILAIVGTFMAIGFAFYFINRWHQSRQEAATPGILPVPEKA